MLEDTQPEESKSLMELKSKKKAPQAAAPVPGQQPPVTPARQTDTQMGGTDAAAAVLNAVDEDVEGGEEAELPDEFEVEDAEDEGDVE